MHIKDMIVDPEGDNYFVLENNASPKSRLMQEYQQEQDFRAVSVLLNTLRGIICI